MGAKFRTEIELLSLAKLRKNISPPQNLLNKKSTPMFLSNIVGLQFAKGIKWREQNEFN